MTIGFQTFNEAGALVISSDHLGTYYRDNRNYGAIADAGYFNINTPIGNGVDMGYISNPFPANTDLLWFKFNANAKILFNGGEPYGTANAGKMVRTGSDVPIQSGYLDVYNANGALVWSAVSAYTIPRVVGFYDIPPGWDLDNTPYSQSVAGNLYLLASAAPSNMNTDGAVSGYNGLMFNYQSGNLQCFWARKNQSTWAQTMKAAGLRIPLAIITRQ